MELLRVIRTAPPIFVVNLGRFHVVDGELVKRDNRVSFTSTQIDITGSRMELVAVVLHEGVSLARGEYSALLKVTNLL